MKFEVIILSLTIISGISTEKRSYDGYSVFKITPKTDDDIAVLIDLQKARVGEFWDDSFYKNYEARIMVSNDKRNVFEDIVGKASLVAMEIIKDLQRAIDDQLNPVQRSAKDASFLSMNWNQYYSLEEINDWLDEVERNYPRIVTRVIMGQSVENRTIRGVRINYRQNANNTLIGMYTGTLHAREWITTTTITWIIKEFLTSTDPEIRALAENFEWHLFPVVNPDGYVYTFTTNRMWRKNRSTRNFTSCATSGVPDDMSNGVDLNRNFDYVWMSTGASDNACSNVFAGPAPASEPETQAISEYVLNLRNRGRLMYFIDFHSYTQLVCIPYSHVSGGTDVLLSGNFADMYEVAARGADRLAESYGTVYRVGVAAEVLYPMSGTAFDWVKNATNVPISYLVELRDLGEYGFLLPPEQIIPNNIEMMDALLEMDRTTRKLGYYYSGANSVVYSFSIVLAGLLIALIY